MKHSRLTYIKNILAPCFLFSCITGVATGAVIFLFRFVSSYIFSVSDKLYGFIRQTPTFLPLMIFGVIIVALCASFLLHYSPNCRGGGIPTSVAILRGLIDFNWLKSIFILFISACASYLCGIPLGTEGPSVQMGTAIGRGSVEVFAKRHRAWDRYMMTGGACAGFAAATGAPLTGIFFAFEEAHRRFSPMIFMVASMSVIAGTLTMNFLCGLAGISPALFGFQLQEILPLRLIWTAIVIGLICGILAILFTKLYRTCGVLLNTRLQKIPFAVKMAIVFVAVACLGFCANAFLGSGHSVIEWLLEGEGVWYFLLLCLAVRVILLIIANQVGVSGGVFIPTLTFGAIMGALCAKAMVALDVFPEEYYMILVIVGMSAFLSAAARTPITAIVFALEALSGLSNILPIAVGVTFSYLVIETMGVSAFNETVVEGKVEHANRGKTAQIVNAHLTVGADAFVVGKEIRDILWPPTCVVLSVDKSNSLPTVGQGIAEGDVLHIHYRTYDPELTAQRLEELVGIQENNTHTDAHPGDETHQVPEI